MKVLRLFQEEIRTSVNRWSLPDSCLSFQNLLSTATSLVYIYLAIISYTFITGWCHGIMRSTSPKTAKKLMVQRTRIFSELCVPLSSMINEVSTIRTTVSQYSALASHNLPLHSRVEYTMSCHGNQWVTWTSKQILHQPKNSAGTTLGLFISNSLEPLGLVWSADNWLTPVSCLC